LSHPDTEPVMEVPPSLRPEGTVCPACGAVNENADARYCLRCGRPLPGMEPGHPATQPSMVPRPSMPVHPATKPSMPPLPGGRGAPTAPSPRLQAGKAVTERSPRLPPSVPSSKPKKGLPRWVVWTAVGCCGLGCLVVLAAVALVAISQLGGIGWMVAPVAIPTESSVMEVPPAAAVDIVPSVSTLRRGELLTVTVIVANTGGTAFEEMRCHLVWEGPLAPTSAQVQEIGDIVEPGQSRTIVFVLEAVGVGEAAVQVSVTMRGSSPGASLGEALSERRPIVITE
jgi:hypothetical protein